ncbi:hypothetical protein EVAR_99593_1 [Eumeta japonica]|uniref:Uncharacterized protein n=1 Tax=Eumeta variegata TaxID=151549 RepID=A0A4C1ZLX6_EUMVA|nr:hypothetical protein EVAR_99593_1 [Eumeta japonica]
MERNDLMEEVKRAEWTATWGYGGEGQRSPEINYRIINVMGDTVAREGAEGRRPKAPHHRPGMVSRSAPAELARVYAFKKKNRPTFLV